MITDQSSDAEKQEREYLRKAMECLEIQLKANPIYARLSALREMLAEITGPSREGEITGPSREAEAASSPAGEILAAAEDYLTKTKTFALPAEMLPAIKGKGLKVGGENPAETLSGTLAKSDKFAWNTSRGWGLKEFSGTTQAYTYP